MPEPAFLPLVAGGGLALVEARSTEAVAGAIRARASRFRPSGLPDGDRFDPFCRHFLLRRESDAVAVGGFRLQLFADGSAAATGYSAGRYDLAPLARIGRPVAELGRFWLDAPQGGATDGIRLMLAGLTRLVLANRIALLFGCASFPGAEAGQHAAALSWLQARHAGPADLGPKAWHPAPVPLAEPAAKGLPPLLRLYLGAGAWVGPDAVEDADLGTTHVFMALEPARVPPPRARAMKALARLALCKAK
ncbi:GNAT family N-acetyltransferase [Frigidibacter sp. SD6-1]|uniref:GNAT family N-acetyltransferase n=1 Tax=Frigidibacter sp. SD6-1 TaxID=3032581 RepID=UPI0024DF4863|nr:GNAT family N-acetyltransferase [Frigidibacter sp. SD6-1]